jgi:DnaJ-class molecular chaperone
MSVAARIMVCMSLEMCERCDGTGADPIQPYRVDEVALCVECGGDGCHRFVEVELQLTA